MDENDLTQQAGNESVDNEATDDNSEGCLGCLGLFVVIMIILAILNSFEIMDFRKVICNFIDDYIEWAVMLPAIFVAIWWRQQHIYLTNNMMDSWFSTYIGAVVFMLVVVFFFKVALVWCLGFWFDWWYWILIVIAGLAWFIKNND